MMKAITHSAAPGLPIARSLRKYAIVVQDEAIIRQSLVSAIASQPFLGLARLHRSLFWDLRDCIARAPCYRLRRYLRPERLSEKWGT
jgi:hypothetical protein